MGTKGASMTDSQQPTPVAQPPVAKKMGVGSKIAIGCGGLFALFMLIGLIGAVAGGGKGTSANPAAAASTTGYDESEPGNSQQVFQGAVTLLDTKPEGSLALIKDCAERGNINAQFCLGCLYDAGVVVKKNRNEATEWLRKCVARGAAAKGDTANDMQLRTIGAEARKRLKQMGVK